MPIPPSDEPLPWLSVSDLSEYAFCPRALWYRRHPPDAPPSEASERSTRSGRSYHRRQGRHVRSVEGSGSAAAIALAVGVALLLLGLVLSGVV